MIVLLLVLAVCRTGGWAAPPQTAIAPSQDPQEAVQPGAESQPLTVFRSDVALVRLDVQVMENGSAVEGLRAPDFIVYDEGQPAAIQYFGRDSERIELLLLLDVSGSMRRYLEDLAKTSRQALGYLKSGDRVGIMLFARRAELYEDFTSNTGKVSSRLKDAIDERNLGSGTAINSAILSAAAQFSADANRGRRSVVILTDNQGLNYQVPDQEVIDALLGSDAVLNAIVVGNGKPPDRSLTFNNADFSPSDVFLIADKTGGEVQSAKDAGRTFSEILERLRSRYTLDIAGASEAPAGTFRRVRVELTPEARKQHPKAQVRARSGYTVNR